MGNTEYWILSTENWILSTEYRVKYWLLIQYYRILIFRFLFELFIYLLFLVTWPPGAQSISTAVFVSWRSVFDRTGRYQYILLNILHNIHIFHNIHILQKSRDDASSLIEKKVNSLFSNMISHRLIFSFFFLYLYFLNNFFSYQLHRWK